MGIKLVAIDMDGTLLNDDLTISTQNKKMIHKVMDQGIKVTLVTGRAHIAAKRYAEELSINAPLITYNGALIRDISGDTISFTRMDPVTAFDIVKFGEKYNLYTKLYFDDIFCIKEEHEEAISFFKKQRVPYRIVGNLVKFLTETQEVPYLIVFKDKPEVIKEAYKRAVRETKEDISFTWAFPTSLEMMAPGVTKQSALKFLANRYGINKKEVLAFGNSINDLEMLYWAGIGIAMKNSYPELLSKWKRVSTHDNNNNGVAWALIEYLGELNM